jgi:hypothetical protein
MVTMADFKWEKNPKWTWVNNVMYWLLLPFEVVYHVFCWLLDSRDRCEFGLKEIVELAEGITDFKCGRWYKFID